MLEHHCKTCARHCKKGVALYLIFAYLAKDDRARQDLIYCYKVVFGHANACDELFTRSGSVNTISTRDYIYKLFPHCSRIDARKFFFSERVINSWNSLPAETEHFRSLSTFKRFIRSVDLTTHVSLGF